jgi:hypothetical protein
LGKAKVKIVFDMAASNPLLPAPTIDYDFDLVIDYSDPYAPTYSLTGSQDGFPCYEVYVGDVRIHQFDSGDNSPAVRLPAPQEVSVDESGPLARVGA